MTARPRARRKAERPSEILEAAFEEFAEKGFVAARLEDVARRAGVTKGTIYVYFPTKEAVFLAMSEAFSQEMGARLAVFLAEAPREEAALAEAALDYFYGLTADPRVGRMLLLLVWRRAFGGRREAEPQPHLEAAKRLILDGIRPRPEA